MDIKDIFYITPTQFQNMTDEELKKWNKAFTDVMCPKHMSQYRNNCGYCKKENE